MSFKGSSLLIVYLDTRRTRGAVSFHQYTRVSLDTILTQSTWPTAISFFSNVNKAMYTHFDMVVHPNTSVYWAGRYTNVTYLNTTGSVSQKSLGWMMR